MVISYVIPSEKKWTGHLVYTAGALKGNAAGRVNHNLILDDSSLFSVANNILTKVIITDFNSNNLSNIKNLNASRNIDSNKKSAALSCFSEPYQRAKILKGHRYP